MHSSPLSKSAIADFDRFILICDFLRSASIVSLCIAENQVVNDKVVWWLFFVQNVYVRLLQ